MVDPSVKNPLLVSVDSWVVHPALEVVGAFETSVKQRPLIPMGTPDPFVPSKAK